MQMLSQLRQELKSRANPEKARLLQRFFKTGKGEYAEGDVFLGITVPECRTVAKKYYNLPFKDIEKLLHSKIHEERLVALLLLVQRCSEISQDVIPRKNSRPRILTWQRIVAAYLRNTHYVNNWDLVDLSAPKILGVAIFGGLTSKSILTQFARSKNLW